MPTLNKYKRQESYAKRQRKAGNVLVSVWVPKKAKGELAAFAGSLRQANQQKEVQQ